MYFLRSAREKDLNDLLRLARHLNSYNLPADKKVLRKTLHDSEASFRGRIREAHRRRYLFVAEEMGSAQVVGCSLVIARHGTPEMPHLSFELGRAMKKSRFLRRRFTYATLQLQSDTQGFTELGGLTVLPRHRGLEKKLGKQLSYVRFAYMARHPEWFQKRLLVEYLPKINPKTGNPLWGALGQKLTGLTYYEADQLSAINKEFILSLFPHEKIDTRLLPDAAAQNLGVPGPGAKASMTMLKKLSFRFLHQIDPFDGGPHFGTHFKRVSLIRETAFCIYGGEAVNAVQRAAVVADGVANRRISKCSAGKRKAVVMREIKGEVRAVVTEYGKKGPKLFLPVESAEVLGVRVGEKVSLTPF